jgi:6-phosphogluconolactonase (cycloisomerase 2 family)
VLTDDQRDPDDAAAVTAFKVNALGGLEQEGLYPTGGYSSARDSSPTPCVDALRGRLFVPNNWSNDVSVFTIHSDGSLDAVPGSPFPTGDGTAATTLHPSGTVLYVSQWRERTVGVYEVTESGQLTPMQTVGPLYALYSEVSPDGDALYVTDMRSGVRGYHISYDGMLAEMSESPFTYPVMNRPHGIELSSDGSMLFALDLDEGIAVFNVQDSGALSLVAGSPFPIGGFSHSFALTGDDRYIYAHSTDQIHGFEVLPDGSLLQVPDSPFFENVYAWTLLNPPDTPWLYAGNRMGESIAVYAIAPDGALEESGSTVEVEDPLGRVPRGAIYYRPGARKIEIDIKPENGTNPINPRSHGVTPVALLGSEDLDVADVDLTTLRFGPNEAAPAHDLADGWPYRDPLRDMNGDGFLDLLMHFRTQETGIQCGDTETKLTGHLLDGTSIEGMDKIRTVGCSYKAKSSRLTNR